MILLTLLSHLLCAGDFSKVPHTVKFQAIGKPSALKINGISENKLTGNLNWKEDALKFKAELPLDSLSTGIELRDRHMKEKYLQTTTYPTATLSVDLALPKGKKEVTTPFTGQLTLHGKQKAVSGESKIQLTDAGREGEFSFEIQLEDFGIEVPSYLGITVSKKVIVTAQFKDPQ